MVTMRSEKTEPLFMMIFDKTITEGETFHLNEQELYLYGLLRRKQNLESYTETSIAFLEMTSPLKFSSSPQRSHNQIKDLLMSMKAKGVIRINATEEQKENHKPNDYLKIDFVNLISGYTKVPFSEFDSFEVMSDFYIYVAVTRWKSGVFTSSYGRWADILQISERYAIAKVKGAIERKVIYKNIGDYTESKIGGQKTQKVNSYSANRFPKEAQSNITKAQDTIKANEEFHNAREQITDEEQKMMAVTKVFATKEDHLKRNIFPSVEDYVYYIRTIAEIRDRERSKLEEQFLRIADERIAGMKKNEKFKRDFQKAIAIVEGKYTPPKEQSVADLF